MAELLRFYNDFQPSHYDLYIDINRSKKTIVGKTTIVGEAKKTDIAIHQKYLNVKSVKENGKNAEFKVDDANDAILIKLENAGKTELFIEYDARLNSKRTLLVKHFLVLTNLKPKQRFLLRLNMMSMKAKRL